VSNSNYILELKDISKNFGGLQAINRLSFQVEKGLIFSIIGPNGAGKTTAINLITGIYPPGSGDIFFEGQKLIRKSPYQVAHMGIGRTFQNIQVFRNMTVRENIMVGLHTKSHSGFLRCLLYTPMVRKEEKIIRQKTDAMLEFLDLDSKADLRVASLPYGDQKRVEIARTLAMEPRLLFLDEPSLGLAPLVVQEIISVIERLRNEGTTILLVEQNARAALKISDRAYVLETGKIRLHGIASDLLETVEVKRAYLGQDS